MLVFAVPTITHVHGQTDVPDFSDGYTEVRCVCVWGGGSPNSEDCPVAEAGYLGQVQCNAMIWGVGRAVCMCISPCSRGVASA